MIIIELVIILFLPAGILWLTSKVPFLKKIGAIAICYLCGFLFSLLPIPYDKSLSQMVASVIVAIAIPLILFGFDLRIIRSLAKDMLKGYGLQIVATILCVSAAALIAGRLGVAHAPQLGGMAAGLYTGGTPNLIAVGNALVPGAESAEVITSANTADFIVGGIYFFLIITIFRPVYRRFLGKKTTPETGRTDSVNVPEMSTTTHPSQETVAASFVLSLFFCSPLYAWESEQRSSI